MKFRNDTNPPVGWRIHFLEKLAKRGSGHTPDKSMPQYYDGEIKWVSLADSSSLDYGYIFKTKKKISEEGIKNSSAVIHPAGTVILSRDAGVGKSAVLAEPMAVSQHFIAWQCDNTKNLNNWFLYYWLQMMKPEFERQAVGSTIKTIGLPYFKKLKIVTPEICEQQKIAKILSTWDKAIEKLEALIATKQKRKKALMQQLLTGMMRFPGFEGEWRFASFDDLFIVVNDKKTQVKSSDYLESGSTPIIDQGQKAIAGFTNNGAVYRDVPVIIFGDHTRIIKWVDFAFAPGADGTQILKTKKLMDLKLGFFLLSHVDLPNLGYSRHMRELKEKEFKFPVDNREQQKIASVFSTADKEIATHKNQLAALKQQKKGLMQQLLTGKKRVKVNQVAA